MCFGVRDAIALAVRTAEERPVTVLGDLVHNETVMSLLRERGVRTVTQPDAVETQTVMITAHGASQRTLGKIATPGREVLEATCPLVHYAHRTVARLVQDGYHPVIVGKRDHVEVRGITEDLQEVDVVLTEEDVDHVAWRAKFGVAAQTTQPLDRVLRLVNRLKARFPDAEVKYADTVCQPTKQRQAAALALAAACDVVLVIGGAQSNNTRELVETCRQGARKVYHVRVPADVQPEWFEDGATVGITAGTSTPDSLIDAVEMRVRQLDAAGDGKRRLEARAREGIRETAGESAHPVLQ